MLNIFKHLLYIQEQCMFTRGQLGHSRVKGQAKIAKAPGTLKPFAVSHYIFWMFGLMLESWILISGSAFIVIQYFIFVAV